MGRYEVIQIDDNQYFFKNSRLLLLRSALTRDIEYDSVLVQLKMMSHYQKMISSITVEIICFDLEGNLLEKKEYQYLDLAIRNKDVFADRIPVYLGNNKTRKYLVVLKKIIFEGGAIKVIDNGNCHLIPSHAFPFEGNLKDQFIRNIKASGGNAKTQYLPERFDVFWKCSCGYINSIDNEACSNCGCEIKVLESNLDIDKLNADLETFRIEEEEKEIQQKKARAKTIKRAIAITIAIIIAAIGLNFYNNIIAPDINYQKAQKAYQDGEYDNAIVLLEKLGEYKEAPELLKRTKYDLANRYFEEEKYKKAEEGFEELGYYEDSRSRKIEAERAIAYEEAVEKFNEGNYFGLIDIFTQDMSFKDSSYYLGCCYKRLGDDDFAIHCFEQVPETSPHYEDAKAAIKECEANLKSLEEEQHYKDGVEYAKKGYVYSAKNEFEQSNGYGESEQYLKTINEIIEEGWVGIYLLSDEKESRDYLGIFCKINDYFEKTYIVSFQGGQLELLYTGSEPREDGTMVVEDTINNTVDVEQDKRFTYTSDFKFQKDQSVYERPSGGGVRGFGPSFYSIHKEKKILKHNKTGLSYTYRKETSYYGGEKKGLIETDEGSSEYNRIGDENEREDD